MRTIYLIVVMFIVASCNSTQLTDYWMNPEIDSFESSKILIVGITPNKKARKLFEKTLASEYKVKAIEAVMSLDFYEDTFTNSEKSEKDLLNIEKELLRMGFDAVVITKIVGSKDREAYYKSFYDETKLNNSFREDFIESQHLYQDREYYEQYKVYSAETSLYCICSEKTRDLIWKGYIDIIDPNSIKTTVHDYIEQMVYVLEELELMNRKSSSISVESMVN